MIAAMKKHNFSLVDGAPALLTLLRYNSQYVISLYRVCIIILICFCLTYRRKKTVCEDLIAIWIGCLLHEQCTNRASALALVGQITGKQFIISSISTSCCLKN
jgi:hypothetical protein